MHKLVIMGVAGSGKSTLGTALAQRLHAPFIEGDDHHAPSSQDKMRRGIALDDADREPWLDRLGELLAAAPGGAVLACSALARRYRDRLRRHVPALRFVYLEIDLERAAQRVGARRGHLFGVALEASQFGALEPPRDEPDVLTLPATLATAAQVDAVLQWLRDASRPSPAGEPPPGRPRRGAGPATSPVSPRLQAVADALVRARASGVPVDAAGHAGAVQTPADAYAVQQAVADALGWFGEATPRHWKSGAGSRDEEPTHAPLPPAGVWPHPARAGAWPFTLRFVEPEIALRLREPVDAARAATLDADGARALIDAMTVSVEVVDSRWTEGLAAPALLRLADLQSHGALVLGDWVPYAPRDWARQAWRLSVGAQPPLAGTGTHALVDPAWVLPAWLRHATRGGRTLAAGSVVTTGSWIAPPPAAAGDAVRAVFDGIGEAALHL